MGVQHRGEKAADCSHDGRKRASEPLMKSPTVTVFIPAYNAEPFLHDAVESVVAQSFPDFELLIIDDGSRDRTREAAEAWATRDSRIRVVSRENRGRPATRNEAFDRARGRYLAVLDADDLAAPHRLERQVAYLDAHPDVALCGSHNVHVRHSGDLQRTRLSRSIVRKHAVDVRGVRAVQFFDCAIRQSTAMFRMDTVRARGYRYNPAYPLAEDFELWSRILQSDVVANLPEVLGYYRRHGGQSTQLQFTEVHLYMASAARATWSRYGVDSGTIVETLKLLRPEYFAEAREVPRIFKVYRRLLAAAERGDDVDMAVLKDHVWLRVRRALKRSLRRSPMTIPCLPGSWVLGAVR
jgi:glycosyltransferase involved in cell wall biosynthesis